ncbi:MAG: RNA 2',3'-cyclic phosphodiesterase [Desulfatiglandales bacterium]
MEIRSFLAFELPNEMANVIRRVSGALRKAPLDVRWVKEGNIHLTMIFLGDIKADDLGPIEEAVGNICAGFGPFSLSLSGVGCFPNVRNPRVVWLGLEGELGRLSGFRDALQRALKDFGIKEEKRPFRPHLTMGRFRKVEKNRRHLEDLLSAHREVRSPACLLDRLILFKSTLNPGGPVYTKLASWPLEGEQ